MTNRMSFVSNRRWLLSADPAQPVCAYRSAAQKRRQATQCTQRSQHAGPLLRPSQPLRAPSAAPLKQLSHQPCQHFPHRSHQDPRGFHLGRFSNAGRGRASAQRSAATRIRKPSPQRTLAMRSTSPGGLRPWFRTGWRKSNVRSRPTEKHFGRRCSHHVFTRIRRLRPSSPVRLWRDPSFVRATSRCLVLAPARVSHHPVRQTIARPRASRGGRDHDNRHGGRQGRH